MNRIRKEVFEAGMEFVDTQNPIVDKGTKLKRWLQIAAHLGIIAGIAIMAGTALLFRKRK